MVHCPSCGAGLRFDIERQQMFCDHCQSLFDPQRITDSTYNDAKTENNFETYSYICPDCGAELMTNDKRDAIGFCPYCRGASMIFDRIRRDWKPDGVIPVAVTKEQCKQAYVKEVKRHLFVSRKYCKPELIESFRGIYMPYWSYEAALKGKFHITAESLKTGVVLGTVTSKTYSVTRRSKSPSIRAICAASTPRRATRMSRNTTCWRGRSCCSTAARSSPKTRRSPPSFPSTTCISAKRRRSCR